ncbi:MAG: phospho-N-acetylmuramoyl-pentapeptide-transferase [Acidimicrobiia bacterium]|nr:phospho-N-acetylmuramoyl-pentapeptide-transferase [Acidimicrobiia bacterium]
MIRLLIAGAVSLLVSLVGTRYLVRALTARRIGQPIRAEGPQGHQAKAGTPTMGGLAIVVGAVAGYVVSNLYRGIYTRTGLAVMATIVGAGAVGLLDDWTKVTRARNLGLTTRTKLIGQLVVALFFVVAAIRYFGNSTTLSFTRWSNPGWDVGPYVWAVLAVLWILGSTNAVNLTDGLDGLAAGSSALGFAAYVIIGFWQFRHYDIYLEAHALDLAVIAAAMAGGCVGFLWWNAPPASIFMGDAGSLALGAAFATLALTTDTMLLLPILGGLFVMETSSVIIQVTSFKMRRKRVFRMAPIHHHFELGGWPETTVIIRFWIIAGLCTAVGLGLYYADFLTTGAAD